MSRGLNRAKREIIRGMISRGANDPYIKQQITDMTQTSDWDYQKNVAFCGELAANGYYDSAKNLEWYINH